MLGLLAPQQPLNLAHLIVGFCIGPIGAGTLPGPITLGVLVLQGILPVW